MSAEEHDLVDALGRLSGRLAGPTAVLTQRGVVARFKEAGSVVSASAISKYLNGKAIPQPWFIETLHKIAHDDTISLTDLRKLRDKAAAAAKCRKCSRNHQATQSLTQQLADSQAALTKLEKERSQLEEELAAGLSAHLPVLVPDGDRHHIDLQYPQAVVIAAGSAQLLAVGRSEAALAVLREASEQLTAPESAACLVLLRRRGENTLAETLVKVYGRDQAYRDVMDFAAKLIEHGHSTDARVALQAALR